ncbi:MAG: hypothetical protein DSY47_04070 [Hydrogenothermus sp.]|nr:MAG: hypothetical protein DSY47_04070 [Hydrogenothermus sp.]
MKYRKGLEEVGKAIINIGVAVIIFAIIQPIVNGKFSATLTLGAIFIFILLEAISFFIVSYGGEENEL